MMGILDWLPRIATLRLLPYGRTCIFKLLLDYENFAILYHIKQTFLSTRTTTTNMLKCDGETYLWSGSLSDLKCFVNDTLNLKGKWTSPGGDVKLFSTADSGFLIKWFGLRSQKLAIQADDDDKYLQKKFESLVNRYESDRVGSECVSSEAFNDDDTCGQSSVPQVNDNSLNDLNKNTFDYTNDVTPPPKQPLVSSQLPTTSQINDVSLTQQKNTDDKYRNENLNSQQKSQRTTNKDGERSVHASSIKSSIPCPFLIRRRRCLKGSRCDYKHPAKLPQTPKHIIPCPFLQKRGYCLKENMCDFSHNELLGNN